MTPPPGEFPIAEALSRAFGALLGNLSAFLAFVAVWTVIGLVMILAAPTLLSVASGDLEALLDPSLAFATSGHAAQIAESVVTLAASICMSISWYRYVVLHERPGRPLPAPPDIIGSYTWRSLVLSLPAIVLVLSIFLLTMNSASGTAAENVAIYVVEPIAYAAMAPFCLALPWAAVGDAGPSFIGSLRMTRGHAMRLFWGLLAIDLPFVLLAGVADALTGDAEETSFASYAYRYGVTIVDLAGCVVTATFLALAYLHFTRRNAPERGPAVYFE